jgi:hypothetical protein
MVDSSTPVGYVTIKVGAGVDRFGKGLSPSASFLGEIRMVDNHQKFLSFLSAGVVVTLDTTIIVAWTSVAETPSI